MLKVSFCVIARNEEKALPELFEDILKQDYQHDLMEIILVDGMSTDKTRQLMQQFAENAKSEFLRICVLNNPKKIQSAGWNVVLGAVNEEVILRIDAHSHIPSNFISKNVACLESGEDVCGGQRPCVLEEKTPWAKTLLLAENSLFGSSIAPFRRDIGKSYVKSVFHGAYRREVFEKVGGYNEKLGRTEDNEMNYRIRAAGYRICYDSSIISYQYVRNTLKRMMKQKYGNGYWVGLTLGVCRKCLMPYHFVPFLFIFGIIFTSVLAIFGFWQLAALMWGLYGVLDVIMTLSCIKNEDWNATSCLLLFLFPILHISYGVGTLVGIIKLPFWLNKNEHGQCKSIEETRLAMLKNIQQKEEAHS